MTNIKLALSALKEGQVLKIEPQGTSMVPTFLGGRDHVFVAPASTVFDAMFAIKPKKNDIAVYLRRDGTYVIHRIYKIDEFNGVRQYYMVGDHQVEIEGPLEEDQIHGVVTSIVRKGKTINCRKNLAYIRWVRFWMHVRPFRFKFMGLWWKFKKLVKKMLFMK